MNDPQAPSEPVHPVPPVPGDDVAHDFDGIRELDSNLPLWFNLLFAGTVIWGIIYILHFTFGPADVGVKAWKEADVALQELKAKTATGPLTEDQLRGLAKNPERIASGAKLYASTGCATCHGAEGLGVVGPNLRDRMWIHGSTMVDITNVIANGAANNSMPAQKSFLSQDDMNNLSIFIVSLNRAGLKDGKPADSAKEKDQPIDY